MLAEGSADAETRATLLRIAGDYERMADRIEVVADIFR